MKIEIAAKLPYMSTEMLNRVYGDRVEKLTMGFEVAVDAPALNSFFESDREDHDEDAAKARFDQTYVLMDFSTWLTSRVGNPRLNREFVANFDLVPAFGWASESLSPEAVTFLALARQMGVASAGPGFSDHTRVMSRMFNPALYQFTMERAPRGTYLGDDVALKPGEPLARDLVELLARAYPVVQKDVTEYTVNMGHLTNGLNFHMKHPHDRIVKYLLRRLIETTLLPEGPVKESQKALWEQNALICTTMLAKRVEKMQGETSVSRLYTDATGTKSVTLFDALTGQSNSDTGRVTGPEDLMETGLWASVDEAHMASVFYDAQDAKRVRDQDEYVREDREAFLRDQETNQVSLSVADAAQEYAKRAFDLEFPDEPLSAGGSGYDKTKFVEDESIKPAGFELISVPERPSTALTWLAKKFAWIEDDPAMTTNETTGLHVGVGTWDNGHYVARNDRETIDVLKLLLFLGDKYLLQTFGREFNDYTQPMLRDLENAIAEEPIARSTKLLNEGIETINRKLMLGATKYSSANLLKLGQRGYIEFRIMGGANYHQKFPEVKKTVMRFAQICVVASDPNLYRKEYLSLLYRMATRFNPPKTTQDYERFMRPQFAAFVKKNAASLFASGHKPPSFAMWGVTTLPARLIELLTGVDDPLTWYHVQKDGQWIFNWLMDALNRSGIPSGMRDKLVTYILFLLNKHIPPEKRSANDFADAAAVVWPWVKNVKRPL